MADNETTGSSKAVATDKVTYSGDADQNVQLVRPAHVTGSEGSKTVQDVSQSTGSAVPSAVVFVGGTDGTNARALKTDSSGELQIDVLTVPADPFGVNADAASATGSISAKLRFIAATGIPITGTVTVGSHAVTNAGTFLVQAEPNSTGGVSTMNASSSDGSTALTSTAQAIKGSAGLLCGYYIYNPNATAQFVQFYNTAQGSVTVGTTTPLFMVTIPAASGANLAFTFPVIFSTAMSWAATSTAGGNGAPTTALDAVAWYK